jgi:hypothetical protein
MQDKAAPDNKAVSRAIDVCDGNLNLLYYAKSEHADIVKKLGREEESVAAATAIDDTISMAEYVDRERKDLYEKIWSGTLTNSELEMLRADYFNFQDLLAQEKLQSIDKRVLDEKFKDIVMVYDVNDQSEFIRGYMSNGKQLDPKNVDDKKIIDLLDQSFHSWLVENGYSSQDGIVYNTDKIDKKGNYTKKATPETVATLISNPDKGLNASVKKQSKELSFEVKRHQPKQKEELAVKQQ